MGFHPIIFILAGNRDMHKSLEEFEIWPDPTTDYGVIKKSPYTYNGENVVATFSRLFLIRSYIFSQVMMTYIRAWMSSIFFEI